MRTESTEYIRGLNTRSENHGPKRIQILNRELNYRFEIEPAARTYTAFRVNEQGRAKPAKPSGKTVHNYIDTIDTGERRELLGYAARRVVTKTRQLRDSLTLSESEFDGWYIDPPAPWAKLHPASKRGSYCYVTVGTAARDAYTFTQTGKHETGFVLLATLKTPRTVQSEEVTELSEAPLEPDLFVPPPGFERVPQLSDGERYRLAYRTRLRWEMVMDSLSLPHRIAKFTA